MLDSCGFGSLLRSLSSLRSWFIFSSRFSSRLSLSVCGPRRPGGAGRAGRRPPGVAGRAGAAGAAGGTGGLGATGSTGGAGSAGAAGFARGEPGARGGAAGRRGWASTRFTPFERLKPVGRSAQRLLQLANFPSRTFQLLPVRLSVIALGVTFIGFAFFLVSPGPSLFRPVASLFPQCFGPIPRRPADFVASAFHRLTSHLCEIVRLLHALPCRPDHRFRTPYAAPVATDRVPWRDLRRQPLLFERLVDFTHGPLERLADLVGRWPDLLAELGDQALSTVIPDPSATPRSCSVLGGSSLSSSVVWRASNSFCCARASGDCWLLFWAQLGARGRSRAARPSTASRPAQERPLGFWHVRSFSTSFSNKKHARYRWWPMRRPGRCGRPKRIPEPPTARSRRFWLPEASPRRPRRRSTVPRPHATRGGSTRRPGATSTDRPRSTRAQRTQWSRRFRCASS